METNNNVMMPSMINRNDSEFSRWRLLPTEIAESLRHSFACETYNKNSGVWEKIQIGSKKVESDGKTFSTPIYATPLLNETGINEVMTFFTSANSKIVSLSNWAIDELNQELFFIMDNLSDMICRNYRAWGLNPCKFDLVKEPIQSLINSNYHRAKDAGERTSIAGNHQVHEVRTINNTQHQPAQLYQ